MPAPATSPAPLSSSGEGLFSIGRSTSALQGRFAKRVMRRDFDGLRVEYLAVPAHGEGQHDSAIQTAALGDPRRLLASQLPRDDNWTRRSSSVWREMLSLR